MDERPGPEGDTEGADLDAPEEEPRRVKKRKPGYDGVDPKNLGNRPLRPPTPGSVAMGRAMLGLGEIIEGKPPREVYEHVMEIDESGEPEGPEGFTITIN
jgi:hypothetical protein